MTKDYLKYEGSNYFRQRIVLSVLSRKPIRIDKIRSDDTEPGLRDFEASFLRLIDKLTNGTKIEIGYTGSSVLFKPGVIIGGKITHECGSSKAIPYFLEFMVVLGLFSKDPFQITFLGITNSEEDHSIDVMRTVLIPNVRRFCESEIELKINKRGYGSTGGGEVFLRCPTVKTIKPLQFTDMGKFKRIRGIAHAARVSPQLANRMIESTRSILNQFIPDIYIYTDVYKGTECGKTPGYGLLLVAESTTKTLLSSDCLAFSGEVPEDIGIKAAKLLLSHIETGGCVDTSFQWVYFLLMCLSTEDFSQIKISKLTEFSIQFFRDLKDFFGITFNIKPDENGDGILVSCIGIGFMNYNKSIK